jgi:hypothetical protein
MSPIRIAVLAGLALAVISATRDARKTWNGTENYYRELFRKWSPQWLWGDWLLCALFRSHIAGLVMVWLFLLGALIGTMPPTVLRAESAYTFIIPAMVAAPIVATAVMLLNKPRFLVPPALRGDACRRMREECKKTEAD